MLNLLLAFFADDGKEEVVGEERVRAMMLPNNIPLAFWLGKSKMPISGIRKRHWEGKKASNVGLSLFSHTWQKDKRQAVCQESGVGIPTYRHLHSHWLSVQLSPSGLVIWGGKDCTESQAGEGHQFSHWEEAKVPLASPSPGPPWHRRGYKLPPCP